MPRPCLHGTRPLWSRFEREQARAAPAPAPPLLVIVQVSPLLMLVAARLVVPVSGRQPSLRIPRPGRPDRCVHLFPNGYTSRWPPIPSRVAREVAPCQAVSVALGRPRARRVRRSPSIQSHRRTCRATSPMQITYDVVSPITSDVRSRCGRPGHSPVPTMRMPLVCHCHAAMATVLETEDVVASGSDRRPDARNRRVVPTSYHRSADQAQRIVRADPRGMPPDGASRACEPETGVVASSVLSAVGTLDPNLPLFDVRAPGPPALRPQPRLASSLSERLGLLALTPPLCCTACSPNRVARTRKWPSGSRAAPAARCPRMIVRQACAARGVYGPAHTIAYSTLPFMAPLDCSLRRERLHCHVVAVLAAVALGHYLPAARPARSDRALRH